MTSEMSVPWPPENPEGLGRSFKRLGWIGFWIQVAMLVIPLALLVYVLFIQSPDTTKGKGIDLGNYLSFGSLIVMLVTTFVFWRYTRIGKALMAPETVPLQQTVLRLLWTGLWAGFIGIFLSLILLIGASIRLLVVMLSNPQTGLMVAPGPGGDPSMSLSAFDGISLTTLLVILTAEMVVLGFTIWLLFRTTRPKKAAA